MDQILRGILKSCQPDLVKKTFLERVASAANNNESTAVTNEIFVGILQASSDCILSSNSKLERKLCQEIYVSWVNSHPDKIWVFFTPTVVQYWLGCQFPDSCQVIWLMDQTMNGIRSQSSNSNLCVLQMIQLEIPAFLKRNNTNYHAVVDLCKFLSEHRICIPKGQGTGLFCSMIIHAVSYFTAPKENISRYIQDVSNVIGPLLGHIWGNCDEQTIFQCLENAFLLMSTKKEHNVNPSYALAGVMQYMPNHMIHKIMNFVAWDPTTTDDQLSVALLRMTDWLSWPMTKNAHIWIISFLQHLATAQKFSIVLDVAETVIENVSSLRI